MTLETTLGRTIQDTLYTLSRFELVGDLEVSPEWSVGVGWERQSTVQALGPVRGTGRNALLLRTRLDTRDERQNPRRGSLVALSARMARKHLRFRDASTPDLPVLVRTFAADLEQAQPWGERQVTLLRARARWIRSAEAEVPFYELYPLGGAASLRGYREEQFRGTRVGLLTLEQRLLVDREGSRVFGFTDLGVVSAAGAVAGPTVLAVGYGVGLRLATRLGLAGVDYGLGEGDGPLDGKVHVRLETAF